MAYEVTTYDHMGTWTTGTDLPNEMAEEDPWCPEPKTVHNLSALEIKYCNQVLKNCEFRIIIDVYIIGTVSLLGLVGNTLAFVGLRCDKGNKLVSFLLQALAVADNVYLIFCLFIPTLKTIRDCTDWAPGLYLSFSPLEPWLLPLASITQMTGVWLVVLVTLDRYLAICHPFHRLHTWMERHARKAVIIVPLVALIYNMPRFFEKCVITGPDLCHDNIMKAVAVKTAFRKGPLYYILYKTVMFFLFRMIIPLLTLMILNVKLIQTLKEANRERAQLTSSQTSSSDAFTVILIAVVSVFIMCQVPDFLVRIAVSVQHFSGFRYDFTHLNVSTNMLLTLNSSINVVIYCLTGQRFRTVLKELLCHPMDTMRQGPSSRLRHRTDTTRSSRGTFTMVTVVENGNAAKHTV